MTMLGTRRARRSPGQMDDIRQAILRALEEDRPMTIRQVFYRLVSKGAIEKTENEYNNTVCRLLVEMRRSGEVPFSWIADNTRWSRRPRTFNSLQSALEQTARTYRRALWEGQDAYVEIWLEKDALSGVLQHVTDPWDVPLMVSRGYSSISYLHSAAQAIRRAGKPAFLYYFGDHDPSGVDISRAVEAGIREFAPSADVTFTRVAVNRDQIASMKLPTRPTKPSDSRSKRFAGESVDVDAIPPKALRQLAEDCITRHIDERALAVVQRTEAAERSVIEDISLADWSPNINDYISEIEAA